MMIGALHAMTALAAVLNRPETPAAKPSPSPSTADQVSISDAARALQKNDDWQATSASRKDAVSKLASLESDISGGIDALQRDLGQWLQSQGLDKNANFSVSYDASNKTFNVDGPADVKNALEKELNGNSPGGIGATFRQSYAQLQGLTDSFVAARQAHNATPATGGYSFSLDMANGRLQPNLKPSA